MYWKKTCNALALRALRRSLTILGWPLPGTTASAAAWCSGVLKQREYVGNYYTFAIEEVPWNISIPQYEQYLSDWCKRPSMRSQSKAVQPRTGTREREGDVSTITSYDPVHRNETMFLVYLQQEHVGRIEAWVCRTRSSADALICTWLALLIPSDCQMVFNIIIQL